MTSQQESNDATTERDDIDWQLVAKCRMGKTREAILRNIYRTDLDTAKTATEFAQTLNMGDYPGHNPSVDAVSVALRRLADLGILECKNPESPHHRLYGLTETGKRAVEEAFP